MALPSAPRWPPVGIRSPCWGVGWTSFIRRATASCAEVEWVEEPSYFFKLSAWADKLLAFYDGRIAKWQIPDDVVFVPELPHTATGKLQNHDHSFERLDTGQRMVYDLRYRLLQHLQSLPLAYHLRTPTGDSVYRIDADAYAIENLAMSGVLPLATSVATLAVMCDSESMYFIAEMLDNT